MVSQLDAQRCVFLENLRLANERVTSDILYIGGPSSIWCMYRQVFCNSICNSILLLVLNLKYLSEISDISQIYSRIAQVSFDLEAQELLRCARPLLHRSPSYSAPSCVRACVRISVCLCVCAREGGCLQLLVYETLSY